MAWKGTCYDDGTGRNVYYISENGQVSSKQFIKSLLIQQYCFVRYCNIKQRQRKVPDNYVPELFANGMRK